MSLEHYGWNKYWQDLHAAHGPHLHIARVVAIHKDRCSLQSATERLQGIWPRHWEQTPAVGDWACWHPSRRTEKGVMLEGLLPRKTQISRKVAGKVTGEQCLAANMDWVLITTALTEEFNPNRLERYLAMAWQSGAGAAATGQAEVLRDR